MRRYALQGLASLPRLGTCSLRMSSSVAQNVATRTVPDDHNFSDGDEIILGGRKLKVIGRALESYLNDFKKYSSVLAREKAEFELGKRHLANIMGLEINSITQEDIDRAITYLFPSGLSCVTAHPLMKPPEEILPKFRTFSFTDEGRPCDSLFYTLKPKFYRLLSDIGWKTVRLLHYHHEKIRQHEDRNKPEDTPELILSGTAWLQKDALEKILGESITDEMYAHIIVAFDYLVSLPFAALEKDFILKYRQPLARGTKNRLFGPEVPAVELDAATNRSLAQVKTRLKRTFSKVTVYDKGTGKYTVNGHGLDEFRSIQAREIFLSPMIVTDLLGMVDISATVEGPGGDSVVPRVVRHGVSLCLAALFPHFHNKLRIAGLLTSDPRRKERNKVNQPGARAKWIWKRR